MFVMNSPANPEPLAEQISQQISQQLRGLVIPPCPAILNALQQELRSENFSTRRVAQLISNDMALAAGVLKIANSPLFGATRKISSIHEALNLLGVKNVVGLVINELLRKSLAPGQHSGLLEYFWHSAQCSSHLCSELSGRLRVVDRDTAYTFSLFHDAGMPILLQRFPAYHESLKQRRTDSYSRIAEEDDRYGTNHAVIGYLLARSWGLSDTICQAILVHHDYSIFENDQNIPDAARTLVALNLVAEHVVELFLHHDAPEDREWEGGKAALGAYLGLSTADVDDLCEDLLDYLNQNNQTLN